MKNEKYFLVIFIILSSSFGNASATTNPVMITISDDMNKVIFDGRWSFFTEWKHSSLDTISYNDGMVFKLRTAHQDNFIYVFLDVISDTYLDKGADRAMICFDTNNDKSTLPDSDDYCFLAILDGKSSFVYKGGSSLGLNGNFEKVPTPAGYVGIGGVSNENDRYTLTPHSGYEFRVPTDFVGRASSYGLYIAVYDAHSNRVYSWPQDIKTVNLFQIPSPSMWGEMISPDKSLPEFSLSLLMLISAFSILIYVTKFSRIKAF